VRRENGTVSITNLSLAGHGTRTAPVFDQRAFLSAIHDAVSAHLKQNRKIILLGHSTGGTLALAYIAERLFSPHLLILAAVPNRIDGGYLKRWDAHTSDKDPVPLNSIARMVSLINAVGSKRFEGNFPVLIIHGEKDELVPAKTAAAWGKNSFSGPTRTVTVPAVTHNMFCGPNRALPLDLVGRTIKDVILPLNERDYHPLERLIKTENQVRRFLAASPFSGLHLAKSPSTLKLVDGKTSLSPIAESEPVFVNIEVTTHCNLSCRFCARTRLKRQGTHMRVEHFRYVLDMLPHAYRVTLVGLGEPLLHPQIVDLVQEASSRNRRVTLVSNAMNLNKPMAAELISAGLSTMVFSIDGPREITAKIRAGADYLKIINNIKDFTEISALGASTATAVFTAVSSTSAPYLGQLIQALAQLNIQALMLTDLNFSHNIAHTLWKNMDDRMLSMLRSALARAFSRKLPVLSVHALEAFGLKEHYSDYLLLSPEQLCRRRERHAFCLSPWQTLPVDAWGNVSLCDCQPDRIVGNLHDQPLSEIWNSGLMVKHRRKMLSESPPENCRVCPRF